MPIDKALADDTLLVYAMNGQPLPPDHGFPVRVLVPGWVGIAHIKWVGRIDVSEEPLYSEYNTQKYVLIGPDYGARPPALGPMLTTQKVKSAFELPWNGEVPSGRRLLRGRSWSGEGSIAKVDVSVDGGQAWQPARLREPNIDRAWVRWDVDWDARPGTHRLAGPGDGQSRQHPARSHSAERGRICPLGGRDARHHGHVADRPARSRYGAMAAALDTRLRWDPGRCCGGPMWRMALVPCMLCLASLSLEHTTQPVAEHVHGIGHVHMDVSCSPSAVC